MSQASLPQYINSLQAGYLSGDTRFTNHGFKNGKAVARQSVLQAGTAVLLDSTGVPVVRCVSGSPLLPPEAVSGTPNYTGNRWAGFDGKPVASVTVPQSVLQASGATGTGSPSPSPATSAGPNLVVDGGFEGGLVAPWGTGSYEPRPQGIFWGSPMRRP